MSSSRLNVPVAVEVSITEILQGIFKIEGWLRYADHSLTFEYRTSNLLMQPSGVKTFQLPLESLREITLKGTAWNRKIVLYPRQLAVLDQVPWACQTEIKFQVQYKHRKEAEVLVEQLQQRLSMIPPEDVVGFPFQLPDLHLGLTEVEGFLYLDEEFLVFEVISGVSGLDTGNKEVIKIEPAALQEVHLEPGRIHDRLVIHPKTDELLEAIPGNHQETLNLILKKQYSQQAAALVQAVQHRKAKV